MKSNITRIAFLLLFAIATTLNVSATDFFTDVILIGHKDETTFDNLVASYEGQGWKAIRKDLNSGCGSGSDYIYLLYKTQSSTGSSGFPITDFYIRTGNNPPSELEHEGRTYYLVPCDGSSKFIESQGDLNRGAGGDYIHLYYTKNSFSNLYAVSSVSFNNTQSGAVGENGGTTGYDLNNNCSNSNAHHIYMHVTKEYPSGTTVPQRNLEVCAGGYKNIRVKGWTYDPDASWASLDVHVYIYTDANCTHQYGSIQVLHADVPRPDVNAAYSIVGNHGFDAIIPVADVGNYWVKVWAINYNGGNNPQIGAMTAVSVTSIVTLASGSGEVMLIDGDILTGTGGTDTHVTVADGATVTLRGVNNTAIIRACPGITCDGDAVIVLDGGTTNSVKGGTQNAGIFVPEGKTLTIQGSGTLNATGGDYAAGIGSGYNQSCGNITINGGTITANGGNGGAGIGSGYQNSSCGNITITRNVTKITATKGSDCDNAIGAGGNGSSCGTVTIDGVQGFITQSPFTTYPYTVSFNANGGTGTMADMNFMYGFAQNLSANLFTNRNNYFDGWATSANGPKVYDDGQSVSNLTQTSGATVTLYARWTNVVKLTWESGVVEVKSGNILTGTGGPNTRVMIYADTVTLRNVRITSIANDINHHWAGITCYTSPIIVLEETNYVYGGFYSPGIRSTGTLTIQGSGTLHATGGVKAAGIGCGNDQACSHITISGGTVEAIGGDCAPGIGSGFENSSCGNITITEGVTKVTAKRNGMCDYSIGPGYRNSTCGTVTIGGVQTGFITQSQFTTYSYTVSFDANGGTGTMANMNFLYGFAQNLSANLFTKENCLFGGWATSANGPKVYDDSQSVSNLTSTPGATVTLYAKWSKVVNLTSGSGDVDLFDGDILTGMGGPNTHVIVHGTTVTLTLKNVRITSISDDHHWAGITCYANTVIVLEGTNYVKGGYSSPGICSTGTLTIQGSGTLNATGGNYAAGIGSGMNSSCGNIIISGGTVEATGGVDAAGIGSGMDSSCGNIIISGGTVTAKGGAAAAGIGCGYNNSSCGNITITKGVTKVTARGSEYSIGPGYKNNSCGTVTIGGLQTGFIKQNSFTYDPTENFVYTLSFDANGGTGTMDNMNLMYGVYQNLSANLFTNGNYHFDGWARSANGPKVYGDGQRVSDLTHTPGATVTLYAKWNVTRTIDGYQDGNDKWAFIASPIVGSIAPTEVGNIFSATEHDLYRLNPSNTRWENYKNETHQSDFSFVNGQGYLYATKEAKTLTFDGTYNTDNSKGVPLQQGWNLVGNPFVQDAYANRAFFKMKAEGTGIEAVSAYTTTTIPACTGVVVNATGTNESVTFSTSAPASATPSQGDLQITLTQTVTNRGGSSTETLDNAIVSFNESSQLSKFYFGEQNANIYFPQCGEEYAIAYSNGRGEIPVNFKAHQNGTYTLTVSKSLNSQFSILNLIDNLTGDNIDLLQAPSYTFEGKTSDYASRFKLVFVSNDAELDNEPFAFIHNGELIIESEGAVQVIDMLGHTLFSKDNVHRIPTASMSPGVYVLRLINGEKVKTQKIVID